MQVMLLEDERDTQRTLYQIHFANRIAHSAASSSCLALSAKYKCAIPGMRGLPTKV